MYRGADHCPYCQYESGDCGERFFEESPTPTPTEFLMAPTMAYLPGTDRRLTANPEAPLSAFAERERAKVLRRVRRLHAKRDQPRGVHAMSGYQRGTYQLRRFEVVAPHVRNDGSESRYPEALREGLSAVGFEGWTELPSHGYWQGKFEHGTTFVLFSEDQRSDGIVGDDVPMRVPGPPQQDSRPARPRFYCRPTRAHRASGDA
jgi:hypothetical protein